VIELKERINQALEIQEGFKNLLLSKLGVLEDSIIEEGLRRAAICNTCPLLTGNTCNSNMEGLVEKRFTYYGKTFEKGDVNKGCGCNLPAKWLSKIAKCPLAKWQLDTDVEKLD